jgi:predicted nucleic acid-binding protein
MIYFDTDVLINLLIPQDPAKHQKAKILFNSATDQEQFFTSLLCLQETAFVLQKLDQIPNDIDAILTSFLAYEPVPYGISEMKRGIALAKLIGFQSINDCIHTAIAETHCTEIYTFNKADFKRIKKHSKLKITIL